MGKKKIDPNVGKVIGGFRIEGKVGEGGMGSVYKATQLSLQRIVALKILPSRLVEKNPDFVERFMREARLAAQINHPNIVQVHEAGNKGKVYYMAMEFIQGQSVADMLHRKGSMPEKNALAVAFQVAKALAAAGKINLIHRDIKPDNILITREGLVKVADFGLAKNTGSTSLLTQEGQVMGTPAFMSPEQSEGRPVDHRSDLYSLGATLYQMVTRTPPYTADTPLAILHQHIHAPVPDPRSVRPNISEHMAGIIQKLMAKNPNDRFQSANELMPVLRKKAAALGVREKREAKSTGPPEKVDDAWAHAPTLMDPTPAPDGGKTPDTIGGLETRGPEITPETLPAATRKQGAPVWVWPAAGAGGILIIFLVLLVAGVFSSGEKPEPEPEPSTPSAPPKKTILEVEYPKNGAFLPSPAVEIRGKAGKGVAVTVNGTEASVRKGEFRLKLRLPGVGKQTLRIEAVREGEKKEEKIEVTIDVVKPRIVIAGHRLGHDIYTNKDPYHLEGRLSDDFPRKLSLNGAVVGLDAEGRFGLDLPFDAGPKISILLEGADRAGHKTKLEFQVIHDTIPPAVTLATPAGGKVEGRPRQTLRFRFSEPVEKAKVNGDVASPSVDEFLVIERNLEEGENRFTVEAVDRAGNPMKKEFTIRFHDPEKAERESREKAWKKVLTVLKSGRSLREKISRLETYLKTHRGEGFDKQAEKELKKLKTESAVATEEAAFKRACTLAEREKTTVGKIRGFKNFIQNFPRSVLARKALARIEALKDRAIPMKIEGVDIGDEPETFKNLRDGATMVYVKPGRLPRGVPESEGSPREVELSAFYFYKYEVTNNQFAAFLSAVRKDAEDRGKPYLLDCNRFMRGKFPWGLTKQRLKWVPMRGHEDHPAVLVTWHGARAYAKWSGGALPTEMQWEYAARGADGFPYPWGSEPPDRNRAHFQCKSPTRVGSYPHAASPFGATDMAGNVWEWCLDPFVESPKFKDGAVDPVITGFSFSRVLKGGGYNSGPASCKAMARSGLAPHSAHPWLGFRVALKRD